MLSAVSVSQPFWSQYGGNAQHTAEDTHGVQTMNKVLWQTPMDMYPSGEAIHYGSPLITRGGTVIVPVRTGPATAGTGAADTYQLEGHDLSTGTIKWTATSDFTDWMPHDWIPSYGPAVDSKGRVYYPGAGGTVWVRSNTDLPNATTTQFCFYGLGNYQTNEAAYNSNIEICTPITVDANDNIYFGFYVTQGWSNPFALASGIAKISPTGVGTWVTADNASSDTGDEVATNSAPAVSNDGNYVYVAVKQQGTYNFNNPKLLRLNTADLSTASEVALQPPPDSLGNPTFAYIFDDGTASPMVGPDGDVYFGIWYSNLESRGFMLHYSADLFTQKPAGGFGWDDTASIVPSSAVPSYTGSSSYLILTKYNNYSDPGIDGDGLNKVAILDPNALESYTVQYGPTHTPPNSTGPTYQVMQEVMTVLGPTSNAAAGIPGVREWCINMAAVDVAGKAAIVNSEDGHCYRWDFITGQLTDNVNLNQPTAEAYTPTLASWDGIAFAVNDATLYAMWDGAAPSSVTLLSSSLAAGNGTTGTVSLSAPASGPGAIILLSSSNPSVVVPPWVVVPPGQSSATFPVTTKPSKGTQGAVITASRYGFSQSAGVTVFDQALYSVFLPKDPILEGTSATGNVTLTAAAPTTGRTVTLKSSLSAVTLTPSTLKITSGMNSASFTYSAAMVASQEFGTITATLDDNTTLTVPITILAPTLTGLTLTPDYVSGGTSVQMTVSMANGVSSGSTVELGYSAHTSGPSTVSVGSSNSATVTVSTKAVTSTYTETVSATFGSVTKRVPITITPPASLSSLAVSTNSPLMTSDVTGTVTLASAAQGPTALQITTDRYCIAISQPTVQTGNTSAPFRVRTVILGHPTAQASTISVALNGVTKTQTLMIQPIFVTSLVADNPVLHSGQSGTVTVTVTKAPIAYAMVMLCGSNDGDLIVSPYQYMPQGQATVRLPIKAAAQVTSQSTATVSVTLCGVTKQVQITVEP